MKYLFVGTFAAISAATCVAASPAATLLFAQDGTQIVDTNGVARSAKKGDVVQSGERLLTAAGAISQIQLPDGSLIGVRPDSELRLGVDAAGPQSAPSVTLLQGAARVIGSELMDVKKPSNITFQSGFATLRLQGADLESAVVRGDKGTNPGSGVTPSAPGSYQRLLIGSGSIGTGAQQTSLAPRQVNFVGANNSPPTVVASAMPALSMGSRPPTVNQGDNDLSGKNKPSLAAVPSSKLNTALSTSSLLPPPSNSNPQAAPAAHDMANLPIATAIAIQPPPVLTPRSTGPTLIPIAPTTPISIAAPPTLLPTNPTPQPVALPTAPILVTPLVTPNTPIPTAPTPTPFVVPLPTTPIVIATNVVPIAPLIQPIQTIQPIVTLTSPIVSQPIVTKPVCTRLISGKCV